MKLGNTYQIIFDELDRIEGKEPRFGGSPVILLHTVNDREENEEIRKLRRIVEDITEPAPHSYTVT